MGAFPHQAASETPSRALKLQLITEPICINYKARGKFLQSLPCCLGSRFCSSRSLCRDRSKSCWRWGGGREGSRDQKEGSGGKKVHGATKQYHRCHRAAKMAPCNGISGPYILCSRASQLYSLSRPSQFKDSFNPFRIKASNFLVSSGCCTQPQKANLILSREQS